MLTLEEARKLINDGSISDDELTAIIEGLSGLVDACLDDFFNTDIEMK